MAKPQKFDEAAAGYPGVIACEAEWRLVVSPRGASYAVQERGPGGWRSVREFVTGEALAAWLVVVAVDLPASLVSAGRRLPSDPHDCGTVPVPTAPRSAV